jgi:hypothetical protein
VALVQMLNHTYKTSQQMHICKFIFVENCPLEGYYAASSFKNARCLVTTQKSAFLIHLLQTLQIVHLLVGRVCVCVRATIFSARISNSVNYKQYICQCKILVLKETSKNIFFFQELYKFHDWRKNKCHMRVSVIPFSSRVRTPL